MHFLSPKTVTVFAIAGLFMACQREDGVANGPSQDPASRDAAGYSKAWIQLKASHLDPESRAREAKALAASFGYSPANDLEETGGDSGPTGAIPKAGAVVAVPTGPITSQYKDMRVMSGRINSFFAHYVKVIVKNGETLKANTEASAVNYDPWAPNTPIPPADPFMIAFYQTSATNDPNAYPVKLVSISDDVDAGNTNSALSWTNKTGSDKTVSVVSFVYSREAHGFTTARVTVLSGNYGKLKYQKTRWISSYPNWEEKSPNTSSLYTAGPLASKIRMTKGTDWPLGKGFGFVAINAATKNGGFMYDTEGFLDLPSVWTQSYPNLYLGFCECKEYDENNPTNDFFFTEMYDTYGLAAP